MQTEKKEIILGEIYELYDELNGKTLPSGDKLKGILEDELGGVERMWFTLLNNVIKGEKEILDTLRNDLIKKYGESSEDGNIMIKQTNEDGSVSSKFVEFINEFNAILTQKKEITYHPLQPEHLINIKSNWISKVFNFVKI
jgi:hypothetical protein